jgi:diguanylate cyclase (GGDEF)-like protein
MLMVQGKDSVSRFLSRAQNIFGSDLPANRNKSGPVKRSASEGGRAELANHRFGTTKPGGDVEIYTLLRQMASRLARAKALTGKDYHALVTEADRELACLLRDIRSHARSALWDKRQYSPMNELLMRAIYCAAQQHVLQASLADLALTDELTGLYNRRGFMALAERQLKLGHRSGRGMLLILVDVDGLKQINDTLGHSQGDSALRRTAEVLRKTFRNSDVIARMGGDEFAVMAIEASGDSETAIRKRLNDQLTKINSDSGPYRLSLSLGIARVDPRNSSSIGSLMVKADCAMYAQKRGRSNGTMATAENVREKSCSEDAAANPQGERRGFPRRRSPDGVSTSS